LTTLRYARKRTASSSWHDRLTRGCVLQGQLTQLLQALQLPQLALASEAREGLVRVQSAVDGCVFRVDHFTGVISDQLRDLVSTCRWDTIFSCIE
jgi:hypothetical protein